MRTFIQSTAGGSFYDTDDVTYITRKNYIEIVISTKGDWYGVVTVEYAGENKLLVFCNWGHFLDKFNSSSDIVRFLNQSNCKCPKLNDLVTGRCDCSLFKSDKRGWSGIGRHVDVEIKFPILHAVTDEKVLEAAEDVLRYSLDVFNEILDKCPFEDWKMELKKELL